MIDDNASTGYDTTGHVHRLTTRLSQDKDMISMLIWLFGNGDIGRGITVVSPSRREAIQRVPANQQPGSFSTSRSAIYTHL